MANFKFVYAFLTLIHFIFLTQNLMVTQVQMYWFSKQSTNLYWGLVLLHVLVKAVGLIHESGRGWKCDVEILKEKSISYNL